MFGEAWSPMSVPDLAPDDDDDHISAASSLLSRSFVNVQHSHPYRRMDHM